MKIIITVLSLLVCICASAGGDYGYPVSDIPDTLKKGVNVVFREDHSKFTIHSRDRATHYVHTVVTIFNEAGKRYAQEVIGYDKLTKITAFRGASYDADGKLIKRLKQSEIYDQSAYDGFSLYSDNRLKAAQLSYGSYPYTVEFEYEVEYKFLFFIPGFYVVSGERVSVQNSSYQLVYPPDLKPKYKLLNMDAQPMVGKVENSESLTWTFKDVLPIKYDPMGPASHNLIPHIIASPTLFDFDGHLGSAKSWDEFGQWILTLNKDRNTLSPEAVQKVKEITAKCKTKEEKIKAVYEYMQSRTRYVSIQLGIGGFQPFEASLVDKVGYGDCKALSNYMVSMLETVGIKSNYVLIEAGKEGGNLQEDFPSSQFNHAVVLVPNEKDTLWLECTSQTNPFAYMGTFTGNRKALAITDKGASIVRTPIYTADVNLQSRKAIVTVQDNGNAQAKVKTSYSGLKYETEGLSFYLEDQFDDQKKWIERTTDIPVFNINSFKIENHKARIPTAVVNLDLQLDRYAQVNGKRMFITPNLMSKNKYIPSKVENRKSNVVIQSGFVHVDTIEFNIPETIYAEGIPETKKFTSTFGEYQSSYSLEQGKIVYVRRFKLKDGTYKPETYNELIDFFKNINKADNTKVVFVNKT